MVDALAVSCSASDQPARVDTRFPACQPPGERDPPGMEAQEVRRQRQLHDARRRRRRAGATDEEDDASLEGKLALGASRLRVERLQEAAGYAREGGCMCKRWSESATGGFALPRTAVGTRMLGRHARIMAHLAETTPSAAAVVPGLNV